MTGRTVFAPELLTMLVVRALISSPLHKLMFLAVLAWSLLWFGAFLITLPLLSTGQSPGRGPAGRNTLSVALMVFSH